ncbi:ATP-binding protein [Virgibacillus necropolis]|uniref:ATP-binding protein n=1 Tax=Virgibacillus necropolis TaxID=163877 RepID=UPI003850ACB9
MKRDVAVIPLGNDEEIIIASDNSGGIGMKQLDKVPVAYETVSYYSFRVAFMECVAVGALPFSVVIQNFNGDRAWSTLVAGVEQGMKEIGIDDLSITGSTETNMTLMQSAVGITVLGKRKKKQELIPSYTNTVNVAIIGKPLVGTEVINQNEAIAPLNLFQWCCVQESVLVVLPVGSKGILHELKELFAYQSLRFASGLDMKKSSGPSTCFIIVYLQTVDKEVQQKAGKWFHAVNIENYC